MVGTAGFEQVKDNATDWKTLAEKRRFGIEILSNQPTNFQRDAVHACMHISTYRATVSTSYFLGIMTVVLGMSFLTRSLNLLI